VTGRGSSGRATELLAKRLDDQRIETNAITLKGRNPFLGVEQDSDGHIRGVIGGGTLSAFFTHRLVYRIDADCIYLLQCRYHYE
jgi:hypothetical protein